MEKIKQLEETAIPSDYAYVGQITIFQLNCLQVVISSSTSSGLDLKIVYKKHL